ncbi:MAG: hypothetical protein ACO3YX_08385 [Candidatus Nanopelagicaceae bacterium]
MSINPKSLQNLVAGKNKRPDAVRVHARLNPETVELAKRIGDGQISKGLDKMASIYADIPLDNSLSEEDLISWLRDWHKNFPGDLLAEPAFWLEQATLALSGLNFKRMMLLGAKVDIPESDRNRAIARWWKSLA